MAGALCVLGNRYFIMCTILLFQKMMSAEDENVGTRSGGRVEESVAQVEAANGLPAKETRSNGVVTYKRLRQFMRSHLLISLATPSLRLEAQNPNLFAIAVRAKVGWGVGDVRPLRAVRTRA